MRNRNFMVVALLAAFCFVLTSCGPNKDGPKPIGGKKGGVTLDPVFVAAQDNVFLIGSEAAGYQGTAFLIDYKRERYLVSNFHVISLLRNIFIETEKKVAYKELKVLAVDRQHDVAVLEASTLPSSLKGLPYTLEFQTSQKIYIVGYPDMRSKENHLNFGTGVVSDASYMAPFYMGKGEAKNIQLTAPINPGNSGSPVLNERAEVIGVVSWRFSAKADIQGGNYAVPFQYVTTLMTEIENRKQDVSTIYPEGKACTEDDECQWLHFCIDGKCQQLKDQGQPCQVHDDCFLPFNCFNNVCSRMGSLGDMCQNDSQCVPPNYCILNSCRPLGAKGEICKMDIDCTPPLYCIAGKCVTELSGKNGPCVQNIDCKAPLSCLNGTCTEVSGKGCQYDNECTPLYCIMSSCKDLGDAGAACGKTIDCKAGLKCTGGVCQSLSAKGGPCTTDYDCQMPWYCIGGTCTDTGQAPKSSSQGSPCSSDIQCQPPLYCILNACRPLGYQGDACTIDADCHLPLYCISGVCQNQGTGGGPSGASTAQGSNCTSDSQCQPPLYCILNTCRPMGLAGDPCSYDGDCVSPLYCITGLCSQSTPAGQSNVQGAACTNDGQCQPPLYCIVSQCRPLGNVGEPCTYDYDCNVPYICTGGACNQPSYGGGGMGTGGGGSSTPGNPCTSDVDCAPPLYCILQSCRPLGKIGDTCAIDADCSMPFVCQSGKCQNPGGGVAPSGTGGTAGLQCSEDKDCKKKGKKYKYCIVGKCQTSLSVEGEACQYSTDCKKGLFCIVGLCRKDQSGRGEPCRSNDDCKRPYLCNSHICSE
ncbi:MAG: serine protease [Pseudomonadota bacterium]